MKRFKGALAVAACLLTVALGASQAKAPAAKWEHLFEGSPILAGKEGAWIVQEPRVISSGPVEAMAFGPGPNEAVILTKTRNAITAQNVAETAWSSPGKGGLRLNVVNLTSATSKPISLPSFVLGSYGLSWISKGRILSIQAKTADGGCDLLVDVVGGGMFSTQEFRTEIPVQSDVPAVAVLQTYDYQNPLAEVKLRLIDFSVKPPQSRQVPLGSGVGRPILLTKNQTVVCDAGAKSFVEYSLVDGTVKPYKFQGDWPNLPGYVPYESATLVETEFREDPKQGLWLITSPGLRSQVRLSREADQVELSERSTKILFRAHGAAFYCELTPFDLDAALNALMAYAKSNAVMMAKQAGTALHIYGADYDDLLPISGASARDSVYPYIKSGKILDNVIWTNVTGQNMGKIENPATYELGYVPGPGGRAIIYADGHVGWRADP